MVTLSWSWCRDAHSKWLEVIDMSSTTASATIQQLRSLFASYGLPEQLVSDNGPQFVAEEFEYFLKSNGVKHIHSAPYHPSSNGLAEWFVRTFKAVMKASEHPGLSFHQRLMSFLLSYRTTPHATTNVSPSALFLGRHVRTRLDLLHSDVEERVTTKQAQQKMHHDQHARSRDLCVGQRVLARNFRPGAKWIPGTVVDVRDHCHTRYKWPETVDGTGTWTICFSQWTHLRHLHRRTLNLAYWSRFLQCQNFHPMVKMNHHPHLPMVWNQS